MKFYPDIPEKINHLEHYSLQRPKSFACDINMLIGGRRYGKTYSVKTDCIEGFMKFGRKFAWCRTLDKSLDRIRTAAQFFGRLENLNKLGVKEYDIKKDIIYINKRVAGYLFPIKGFYHAKGADYVVDTLVWDEFMRADGEPNVRGKRKMFFDLVESVCRGNGRRIWCISNSTNKYDEMLQEYNLDLSLGFGTYVYRDKSTLIHYIRNSERHKQNMENSLTGVGMSEYDKRMVVENLFEDFDTYGTDEKLKYLFSIQIADNGFISIYGKAEKLFIRPNAPEKNIMKCFEPVYVNNKVTRLSTTERKYLKLKYDMGQIIFADGYSRSAIQDYV